MKSHTVKSGMILTALALAMLLTLASLLPLTAHSPVNSVRAYSSDPGTWLITANFSNSTISLVNTTDNMIYGPFLKGQLGPAKNLFDVAVTPDGKTALVSNFYKQAVYFIDLSTPLSPSMIVSVTLPMPPEDIAITHDGKFALVTDGGSSSWVASISLISRTLVYSLNVNLLAAQAVETAPDGTIIIANYLDGRLGTLAIDDAGRLTSVMSYTLDSGGPVNVGVAPDGQTVLVCSGSSRNMHVYQITSPGNLTYKMTVSGIPTGTQSVAFNSAGDKAYVVSSSGVPTQTLSVLDIYAPGVVALNTAAAADLLGEVEGQSFGVDVIAVVGDKAYVGNPSSSSKIPALRMVDLDDYSVTSLPLNPKDYPIGVAVIPFRKLYLPVIFK